MYSGVGGTGDVEAMGLNTTASAFNNNLTTVTTDLAIDGTAYNVVAETPTKGASQTVVTNAFVTGMSGDGIYSLQSGVGGTTTMTWTPGASDTFSWIGVVLHGQ
jgi:hypothetical protein